MGDKLEASIAMTTPLSKTGLTLADLSDGHLFQYVDGELEKARAEIEQRFLAGGAALAAAYDLIGELLAALDGAVAAFSDESARVAAMRLKDTVAELGRSTVAEEHRLAELGSMAKVGASMTTLLKDMHGILGYIGTCASATRITGAGSDEFIGFADDIATYVRSADGEVTRFAGRLEQIKTQLNGVEVESSRAVALMGTTLPELSTTLIEAAAAIARRRHELEKIATRAAVLVTAVKNKVATVLSGLQIGDVTRQRIEHVQAGIRAMLAETGEPAELEALYAAAHRLFVGLVVSLQTDFRDQTGQVLATMGSLACDAEAILAFHHTIDHSGTAKAHDPMQTVEVGVSAARSLVAEIEAAQRRAIEARDATSGLASELLDDMGRIGNLRNVRDDIRCLAINAFLRCSRMGANGRAVGVIATEMNTAAERLGHAAEGILGRVAGIRAQADRLSGGPAQRDIVGELDDVAATLRAANATTGSHLGMISRQGDAVVSRIGQIVEELDFGRSLGETLEGCVNSLRLGRFGTPGSTVDHADSVLIRRFSEDQYSYYTMASEREVHRAMLPIGIPDDLPAINHKSLSHLDESCDDCFL
ncbi:MAG: methyl-accepting chemotaxis protein [Ancalomicrobiaceae bacterium]|nr:methyl-accepting chemotaxis protein [Ancalomicrobiaceae bacterium]